MIILMFLYQSIIILTLMYKNAPKIKYIRSNLISAQTDYLENIEGKRLV